MSLLALITSAVVVVVPPPIPCAPANWPGRFIRDGGPIGTSAIAARGGGMDREQGVTTYDAARWMADQVRRSGVLDQAAAAERLALAYGAPFTLRNRNGTWAIARPVLAAFRKLTAGTVVWEPSILAWRLRTPDDRADRRQAG